MALAMRLVLILSAVTSAWGAATAPSAGLLAPEKAVKCVRGKMHTAPNVTDLHQAGGPTNASSCVPQFCMEKWCDECNGPSYGLKQHAKCVQHPTDETKAQCEVITLDAPPSAPNPAIQLYDSMHHCVHQDCLTGACDKCHPHHKSQALSDGKSAMCSSSEKGSFLELMQAAPAEELCVSEHCLGDGVLCLTCPCVPPACVPTPAGYENANGYEGASPCYECPARDNFHVHPGISASPVPQSS